MRINKHVGGGIAAAALAVGLWAAPVHATVHEIVAQWCSGHDELEPPGISDPTKKNFAQPLNATGFVGAPVFNPNLPVPGLVVTFNFDHPASKTQGSGFFLQVGMTPGPNPLPIYIELPEPDPDFPAFQHCPRLNTL